VFDPLKQRNSEREGLTGAGARLADDVVPESRDGQGERLDGKWFGDALGFEGVGDFGDYPKFTKRCQGLQPP
jgi:hypothetical protein